MTFVKVIDVCLTINILIKSLTSYQNDVDYENKIHKIILYYVKGTMFFDIASTIPALIIDQNS